MNFDKLTKDVFGMTKNEAQNDGICICCHQEAKPKCYSDAGLREYQISGLCEECFDNICSE